ncbi:hypothetical protein MRX96_057328 [Rhipicephalus microplus]
MHCARQALTVERTEQVDGPKCPFRTDMRHVKGGDNEVEDGLSRNPGNRAMPTLQIDFPALAAAQREGELKHLLTMTTALNVEWISVPGFEDRVCCDRSVSRTRPFAPASLRRHILESLHRLSHPGMRVTLKTGDGKICRKSERLTLGT